MEGGEASQAEVEVLEEVEGEQQVVVRKVVTTNNCGSQLVHTRDSDLNSTLAVLDKLSMWFHPRHYTITEVKMSVIKEWGGDNVSGDQTLSSRPHNKDLLQIPFHSLSQKNLELKLLRQFLDFL